MLWKSRVSQSLARKIGLAHALISLVFNLSPFHCRLLRRSRWRVHGCSSATLHDRCMYLWWWIITFVITLTILVACYQSLGNILYCGHACRFMSIKHLLSNFLAVGYHIEYWMSWKITWQLRDRALAEVVARENATTVTVVLALNMTLREI